MTNFGTENVQRWYVTKSFWSDDYLGPFPVKEEEEDLSKDLLRLEVNFWEVFEEKEEDAALVDFLSQLHLENMFEKEW